MKQREFRFIKASPTQNMTLLIQTPVPREEQLAVAERLISYGCVYAEQAGYIETPEDTRAEKRLQMMAGEFCGNASLSLAAWLAKEKGLAVGEKKEILLEVSGATELVCCEITAEENGYHGRVQMPLPERIEEREFSLLGKPYRFPVVVFEGITHIIVPAAEWGKDGVTLAEQAAKVWKDMLPEVFGILLYDAEKQTLCPLVAVGESSLIWEKGCGSGTCAIGAYLAEKAGKTVVVSLKQPGGIMGVEAVFEHRRTKALYITGKVSIVAEGVAYL